MKHIIADIHKTDFNSQGHFSLVLVWKGKNKHIIADIHKTDLDSPRHFRESKHRLVAE